MKTTAKSQVVFRGKNQRSYQTELVFNLKDIREKRSDPICRLMIVVVVIETEIPKKGMLKIQPTIAHLFLRVPLP